MTQSFSKRRNITAEIEANIPRHRHPRGTLVFPWGLREPSWVIEWQPHNGDGCYWLVNANGQMATAGPNEISLIPGGAE